MGLSLVSKTLRALVMGDQQFLSVLLVSDTWFTQLSYTEMTIRMHMQLTSFFTMKTATMAASVDLSALFILIKVQTNLTITQ